MSIRRDANTVMLYTIPSSVSSTPSWLWSGELSAEPWGRAGPQARGSEGQREQPIIELKRMQADTGAEIGEEGHRASIDDRQYWQSGLEEIPSAPQSNNGGSYIGCLGFVTVLLSSRYRSTLPAGLRWENREIAGLFLAGGGDSCRSWGAYVKPMYIQYGMV
jgi:hypothetical protein